MATFSRVLIAPGLQRSGAGSLRSSTASDGLDRLPVQLEGLVAEEEDDEESGNQVAKSYAPCVTIFDFTR